jgi:outer membrane protein OmpA-like peptidoglycan-associated protein
MMMHKKTCLTIMLSVSVAFLAGCSHLESFYPYRYKPQSAIEHSYTFENAQPNGIVQIYTLNGQTAVQIRSLKTRTVRFEALDGRSIPFVMTGDTALLDGGYEAFRVVSPSGVSYVRSGASRITASAATESDKIALLKEDEGKELVFAKKDLQKEVESLRKQLLGLQSDLAQIKEARRNLSEAKEPGVIHIRFEKGKSVFKPAAGVVREMISKAHRANLIQITGYTDSSTITPTSKKLSRERAQVVRSFMVQNNVDPKKIELGFVPAGGFIANNDFASGRDQNRRVEIRFN